MSAALRIPASLAAGLTFGLGLALSGMLDPARVRGFLDVAGAWDPSLVFVLGGAVTVSGLGYLLSRRLPGPVLEIQFDLPTRRRIDAPLLLGAALFGIGWGLSGFCPGPAVAALSTGAIPVLVFVAAMLAGMALHGLLPAYPWDVSTVPTRPAASRIAGRGHRSDHRHADRSARSACRSK